MAEAWELTISDERQENQIFTYIIFCEDQNDEPYYFRSFQVPNKLKINCIPNQKQGHLNLVNTLNVCNELGLLACDNHKFLLRNDISEKIWCVYDRDLENTDLNQIKKENDIKFTTAIQAAEHAGIKVAWSNDSFELWILLHFELVPTRDRLHRDYVYNRLTDIFSKLELNSGDFDLIKTGQKFSYKTHLKRRVSFLKFVLPILKLKIEEAIKNAEYIEAAFDVKTPYHECNPCTKIHHLVKEVISLGKNNQ